MRNLSLIQIEVDERQLERVYVYTLYTTLNNLYNTVYVYVCTFNSIFNRVKANAMQCTHVLIFIELPYISYIAYYRIEWFVFFHYLLFYINLLFDYSSLQHVHFHRFYSPLFCVCIFFVTATAPVSRMRNILWHFYYYF